METGKQYEAVVFEEVNGAEGKKFLRHKVGNVVPHEQGEGFTLFIPSQMAVSGRVTIQPKRDRAEKEQIAA